MLATLAKLADHPWTKLTVGVVLLVTSMVELITELEEGLQAEHGIAFYGVVMILKSLPELQHSLEDITSIAKK